jgi:hypothetical protein
VNKTRKRAIQKHRARELKFEARRKSEEGGNASASPMRASTPPRPRSSARSGEQPAPSATGVAETES